MTQAQNEILRTNMLALQASNPRMLIRLVKLFEKGESGPYQIVESKSGEKSLKKDAIHLDSAYDPSKFARRLLDQQKINESSGFIVIFGETLGKISKEAWKRTPDAAILVLFQDDWTVLEAFKNDDFSEMLTQGRVRWMSCAESDNYIKRILLASFEYQFLPEIQWVKNPAVIKMDPKRWTNLKEMIHHIHTERIQNYLSELAQKPKWMKNLLENSTKFLQNPGVNLLTRSLSKTPAVVVSAGPSLDSSLPILQSFRGKYLLIAVDTALKPLLKAGIQPDFIYSLDANEANYADFEGVMEACKDIFLISDIFVYPNILKEYPGPIFSATTLMYHFLTDGEPKQFHIGLVRSIEKSFGSKGAIQTGGTVSTSAFELALELDCDPIFLVGQDLAFPDGALHAKGVGYLDTWMKTINRFRTIPLLKHEKEKRHIGVMVEANRGGKVRSDNIFFFYKNWFEDILKTEQREVINTSAWGARIQGAPFRGLRECLAELPKLETPIHEKLKSIHQGYKAISRKKIKDWYRARIAQCQRIEKKAEKALKECKIPEEKKEGWKGEEAIRLSGISAEITQEAPFLEDLIGHILLKIKKKKIKSAEEKLEVAGVHLEALRQSAAVLRKDIKKEMKKN